MRDGGGAGSAAPALLSYLNGVLSARGAAALPYAEELKWTIREHVLQLLQARTHTVCALLGAACTLACVRAACGEGAASSHGGKLTRRVCVRVPPLAAALPVAVAQRRQLHAQRRPHRAAAALRGHAADLLPGARARAVASAASHHARCRLRRRGCGFRRVYAAVAPHSRACACRRRAAAARVQRYGASLPPPCPTRSVARATHATHTRAHANPRSRSHHPSRFS
jgi:hypothetical protein